MARIDNTTKSIHDMAGRFGLMAPIMGSGGIERQEADGQRELCASEQLPAKMIGGRAVFEAMGIIIVGPSEGDDLFVDVKLPQGWRKRGTTHAMHSELLDAKGNVRAEIFYKAAFYDRRADIIPSTRFSIECRESADHREVRGYVVDRAVNAKGVVEKDRAVFVSAPAPMKGDDDWAGRDAAQNAVVAHATAWLDAHYPTWKSPAAHWEDAPPPTVTTVPAFR